MPPTVAVSVTASNGGTTLDRLGGAVDVETSNGSIRAHGLGDGAVDLRTRNGDIDASFDGAPSSIKAQSSNADVTVTTDGRTTYFDHATTTNGTIRRDNPGAEDYTLAPVRMIDVRTTNCNVTIR